MTLLRKKRKLKEKKSCGGCKHFDYYNDGSPFCTKGIEHACISSGFIFKERELVINSSEKLLKREIERHKERKK